MLGTLERAVEEIVAVEVANLCDSEIRERFVAMRRNVDRLDAHLAELVAAVHHRKLALGDGAVSTPAWVQAQTGQRIADARTSLLMGLACESLPVTKKAWQQGEISTSLAATICRGRKPGHEAVYVEVEESLVAFAAQCDVRAVDQVIRHYQARVDAVDGIEPEDLNGARMSRVGNRWALNGDFDELAGATIDEAVRTRIDKPSAGDTRSYAKRYADALTNIARFSLDYADAPAEGGEVPHIGFVIHTDGTPADTTYTAGQISQLLCEANVSRVVLGADSVILDVGRTKRVPSRAIRRAIAFRDQGCRFPGCGRQPSWCQTHHVTHWHPSQMGETNPENLVLLCDFHHGLFHKHGWHATFDGTTFTVTRPNGTTLGATTTRAGP
jgi:hypothetical protein